MAEKEGTCLFTGTPAWVSSDFSTDNVRVNSESCGIYVVHGDLSDKIDEIIEKHGITQGLVNCAARSLQLSEQKFAAFWVSREIADSVKAQFDKDDPSNTKRKIVVVFEDYFDEPVDHSQKPFKLLQFFAESLETKKAFASFHPNIKDQIRAQIVDLAELNTVLDFLESKGLLLSSISSPEKFFGNNEDDFVPSMGDGIETIFDSHLKISIDGWEYLRSSSSGRSGNYVFIATAFSWPEDNQLRSEAVEAIQKVCSRLGYEANIVSQGHTENITDRILAEIKRAKFVIAELTYHNRGVYFESGFARGLGKNVFHLVREGFTSQNPDDDKEGKRIHFDIAQVQYRRWKDVAELESQLEPWIEATVGRYSQR